MKNYTYYLSSHTSDGYVSFFDEAVKNFKKIIIIKNISSNSKRELFSDLKMKLYSMDLDFDVVFRPGIVGDVSALIVPQLSATVASDELFVMDYPLYSDVIDFTEKPHFDAVLSSSVATVKNDISLLMNKVYFHLKEAKKIHDDIEKFYISNMNFEIANNAINQLASKIFTMPDNKNGVSYESSRFFGTLHSQKSVNYIDELTADISNRIFIKGRPGSGKSTCLKKLASIALEKGYNVERYYCSLDPNSLDMIVVRDLSVCAFDCTEPHQKIPSRVGDEEFDIYNISTNINVDEVYSEELMYSTNLYNIEMKKAKECLYSAFIREKSLDKILNENYREDMKSRVAKMFFA